MPRTPALAVKDDFGPIGKGASKARYVSAENGSEYVIKGPSLTPDHPTVAANEWIAASLASKMGLPILDHQIVTMGGNLFFASSYMPEGTWYPAIDRDLFERCENRDRAYDVVVFDAWLINLDRHSENLVVRHIARSARHLLVLNDHSHLLVSPIGPTTMEDLMGCLDQPPGRFVTLRFIRDSITDSARLSESLDRVEAPSDTDIRAIVASTPTELLSAHGQATYTEFLLERRLRLRGLFRSDVTAFPRPVGPP
jgi:hypothetical protein